MENEISYRCDHCRRNIKGSRLAYLDNGDRWHPLATAIDGSRVPNCVRTDELRRFQETVGRDFHEETFEVYRDRFKHLFGKK